MTKKKGSFIGTIIRLIVFILIVALLLGGIVFVFRFTNGGSESFKTFYLIHDGEDILTTNSKAVYLRGTDQRYDVKYTFDFVTNETRDYSVKIVSNAAADFDFIVDNGYYSWSYDVKDLSSVFNLKKESTYFTFSVYEWISIKTIFQRLYPGKTVTFFNEVDEKEYLFSLIVSSYNEKVTYKIDFALTDSGISLDYDHVIL